MYSQIRTNLTTYFRLSGKGEGSFSFPVLQPSNDALLDNKDEIKAVLKCQDRKLKTKEICV